MKRRYLETATGHIAGIHSQMLQIHSTRGWDPNDAKSALSQQWKRPPRSMLAWMNPQMTNDPAPSTMPANIRRSGVPKVGIGTFWAGSRGATTNVALSHLGQWIVRSSIRRRL